MPDGSILAEHQNPAVPSSIIHEIWRFRNEGATMEQVHGGIFETEDHTCREYN